MLLIQLLIFIVYLFHGGPLADERRHARVYRYQEQTNGAPIGPQGRTRFICENPLTKTGLEI